MRNTLHLAVGCAIALTPLLTLATPVEVTSSVPITTQVVPPLGAIATTLPQIGAAINQNGQKTSAVIDQAAQAQRQQDKFGRETDRLEQSRRSYQVPDSICAESGSGQATAVTNQARATESAMIGGGMGISDSKIRAAVTKATVAMTEAQAQSASIHAQWCDATDYAAYGSTICQGVSQYPAGDKQVNSLFDGAGKTGKSPDLTFNQKQTDAAVAYSLNATPLLAGRQLTKGEVKTASGQQYVGLMTQYQAINSAAKEPMMAIIADSQPSDATKDVLTDVLQTPSAKSYFDATASEEARRTGTMSKREFESFEVGRRYANTAYIADLQAMSGDNLTRELVRVQTLNNWLMLELKQQQEKTNILLGQQLSLAAGKDYRPLLNDKLNDVTAGVARK